MAINFQKVKFTYYTPRKKQEVKYVLKDIDLEIEGSSEFITIVGHTGSGKSTLVQMMNALLIPSSGEINIFGSIIKSKNNKILLKPIRKRVGLVFQFPEYQLFEETVLKDIAFGAKNFGLTKEDSLLKAKEVAMKFGLTEDILEKSPFALSGGQMRKVAICGILASSPDILIFDEPTVGLDPFGKKELLEFLKTLNNEGKTIIVITHDMEVVASVSKRVIVLNDGKIVFDDKKEVLFSNEDILMEYSLDYPKIMQILKEIKKCLNLVNLDIHKYTIEDAYLEIKKAMGENHE